MSRVGRNIHQCIPLSEEPCMMSPKYSTLNCRYDEIDRLETEVKQKRQLIIELEEEGRQLVRKERLLKIQV
jgi:cell division protein FtsL